MSEDDGDFSKENDEYNKILKLDSAHGVVKGINNNIVSMTVYGGAHQFSPGLQIVQAERRAQTARMETAHLKPVLLEP